MMDDILQLRLDQALATHRQRWVLGAGVVASVMIASAFTTVGATSVYGIVVAMLVNALFAIVAASGSGTHAGSVVIALVAIEWLAFVDDVATPRAIGVAVSVSVFHALLAVMASSPHTAVVDARVVRRWGVRSVAVVVWTVAVWALVAALENRNAGGSAALTTFGLVVIAASLLLLRRAALGDTVRPSAPASETLAG